jgi:hypothetical protein
MATIGVGKGSYIRPHRRVRMRTFKVETSQTIRVGDPVVLSTDSDEGNRVKISAADPTTDRNFVGFAAAAITTGATFSAANELPVWLATGDAEFIGHVEDAAAIDNDDIDTEYGIVADSTNEIWRVDRSETSAKVVRILELVDAHGDVNGRVVFHVIAPERLYHD